MSRLADVYSSIKDFVLRRKFQNLLDQINKLDLDVDKINKLKSIVFAAQAADPNEAGEIQLNTDSETGLKAYLNSAVWTFLFLEHYYELYGHMAPEIYPESTGINFPVFRRLNNAQKIAAVFPHAADAGWAASWQLARRLGAYNLNLAIEWHADNASGSSKSVVYVCTGRVVAVGERVDNGGTTFNETITIDIPDGTIEETRQIDYLPIVSNGSLADDDLVIVEAFYRDVSNGSDTLEDDLLLSGWKPYWSDRDVAPLF